MTNEEALKDMAQAKAQQYQTTGMLGGAQTPKRPSLRERVTDSLYRAQAQTDRLHRLSELAALLDENPKVARILDLLDEDLLRY